MLGPEGNTTNSLLQEYTSSASEMLNGRSGSKFKAAAQLRDGQMWMLGMAMGPF